MINSKDLAVLFHDTYERLAPSFGYETRPDTKAFNPESANGKLMIAVCEEILSQFPSQGLKWVKVSERLPEKRHNYFVKALSPNNAVINGYIWNATCLFDGEKFVDDINTHVIENGNTVVEWLDESAPSQGLREELFVIEKFFWKDSWINEEPSERLVGTKRECEDYLLWQKEMSAQFNPELKYNKLTWKTDERRSYMLRICEATLLRQTSTPDDIWEITDSIIHKK